MKSLLFVSAPILVMVFIITQVLAVPQQVTTNKIEGTGTQSIGITQGTTEAGNRVPMNRAKLPPGLCEYIGLFCPSNPFCASAAAICGPEFKIPPRNTATLTFTKLCDYIDHLCASSGNPSFNNFCSVVMSGEKSCAFIRRRPNPR